MNDEQTARILPGGLFAATIRLHRACLKSCLTLVALHSRTPRPVPGTAGAVPMSRTARSTGAMSRSARMPRSWAMSRMPRTVPMPMPMSGKSGIPRVIRRKRIDRRIKRWIVWIRIVRVSRDETRDTEACLGLKPSFRLMTQGLAPLSIRSVTPSYVEAERKGTYPGKIGGRPLLGTRVSTGSAWDEQVPGYSISSESKKGAYTPPA